MSYEKPVLSVLSLAASSVRNQGGPVDGNNPGGNDGKAQTRSETGNDGSSDIHTSTTAAAYEADE